MKHKERPENVKQAGDGKKSAGDNAKARQNHPDAERFRKARRALREYWEAG